MRQSQSWAYLGEFSTENTSLVLLKVEVCIACIYLAIPPPGMKTVSPSSPVPRPEDTRDVFNKFEISNNLKKLFEKWNLKKAAWAGKSNFFFDICTEKNYRKETNWFLVSFMIKKGKTTRPVSSFILKWMDFQRWIYLGSAPSSPAAENQLERLSPTWLSTSMVFLKKISSEVQGSASCFSQDQTQICLFPD